MSEPLLNILKLCLLALLYLFFLRVLRAVWAEVSAPSVAEGSGRRTRRGRGDTEPAAAPPAKRRKRGPPTELVIVEPEDQSGRRFPLGDEITVGRAAGCQVTVDDTYASQLHARVFARDGLV
ncbi:MAG: FHA domain-containing protein, partial [Acidimicrobiales bacterium]